MRTRTIVIAAALGATAFGLGWLLGQVQATRAMAADQIVANWVNHAAILVDGDGRRRAPEDMADIADGALTMLTPLAATAFDHTRDGYMRGLLHRYATRMRGNQEELFTGALGASPGDRARSWAVIDCIAQGDPERPSAISDCARDVLEPSREASARTASALTSSEA